MKHPACEGCEFDGKCLTEKLYEADCPEVQNYEREKVRRFENKLTASGYNLALDDAKAAVERVECPDIFQYAIRLAIAAIEGLRRKG
jgi:poly-gamma-glutamate capsule biosynthesis protein CapA/YwtB (metallophosphatase superfamily)